MIPEVLGLYSAAPVRVRARAWGRWAATPFARVEARVPTTGTVLEVGCGVGVFSAYLSLQSSGRNVLGIDEELDDVVQARLAMRKAGTRTSRVSFELTPPGEIPDGPWDAVVLVDVLGRLDPDARAGMLATCAEQVALGGVLVVKEMGSTPAWKAVSRVRGRRTPGLARAMRDLGLVVTDGAIGSGYPQPHHLFVGARRRSVG